MTPELGAKLQQITEQNIMDIEAHKQQGKSVVGYYCLYGPTELAVAADAIPLPLCGTRQDPIEAAEQTLPRNLCPLIKSSYGFAATGTCPFFKFSDMIVADTTCDGKKKMFEIMGKMTHVHVLQLPQQQNTDLFLDPWITELEQLRQVIGNQTGIPITDERLRAAISLLNREREAKKGLMDVAAVKPSPISGTRMLEILFKTGFFADKEKGIELIHEITEACMQKAKNQESPFTADTPRILLTGVPVGLGSDKVVKILENSGANVVAFENCSGYKQAFRVDEDRDPIKALAEQYLAIPCSVMSPNPGREELLTRMVETFKVDGIVDLTWQACHTYNVEAFQIRELAEQTFNLPYLHLETDYSESDTEQLRVRIEAFLEMI
ncbi:MAG: 2-hydroxyacyl-CoA dehydratase family protein [Desulfobacterales bacterium]|nr:2-hydroxyacyl-CoA dehydratase family protein [Desulfobacterales bacterium]